MRTPVGKPIIEDVQHAHVSVEVQITVRPEEWAGKFNRIEVWRSELSPAGPFEALTANQWTPAILPNSAEYPVRPCDVTAGAGKRVLLTNTTLVVLVDHTDEYRIRFYDTAHTTYFDAALTINAQSAGRFNAYVDSHGDIVLVGVRPGTGASLEVTGGDAAPLLGLSSISPENIAYGRDAHIGLVPGVSQYPFCDAHGDVANFYRARLLSTLTGARGEFDLPVATNVSSGVGLSNLVQGYVELINNEGRPLAQQLVQVYTSATNMVEGKLVSGMQQAKRTDRQGRAEFTLLRGVAYTVSIAGTDIVRQFLAPTDPAVTLFSLLDPGVGTQDDLFTVDRPQLTYAERRTF
jgi:hypothetical protein